MGLHDHLLGEEVPDEVQIAAAAGCSILVDNSHSDSDIFPVVVDCTVVPGDIFFHPVLRASIMMRWVFRSAAAGEEDEGSDIQQKEVCIDLQL